MMGWRLACLCAITALMVSGNVEGQVTAGLSGVPGDGIPDLYYFPRDGLIANTTFGPITRRAGVMTLDTDGADFVALFIGGPQPILLFPDGSNLPGSSVFDSSTWTAGYSAGSIQFIRTNPLTGPGFQGVVGTGFVDGNGVQQPWPDDVPPFLDFPEEGIAEYPPGLTMSDFDMVFDDGMGGSWNVVWATDVSGTGFTKVTVVPEPNLGLVLLTLLAVCFARVCGHDCLWR